MARSPDWKKPAMAIGAPDARWPLPTVPPKFADWSFGGGRPFGCEHAECERWHAGIDLTGAPDGAVIIAPEDSDVVAIDRGWSSGSKAAFLRTKSGLFLVLGGFKAGSHTEFRVSPGASVRAGDQLGRVLGSYGMIHLETYVAADRKANSVWWKIDPPPKGLLNPTTYVERMAKASSCARSGASEPCVPPSVDTPDAGPPAHNAPTRSSTIWWVVGVGGASALLAGALWARNRRHA
jgi:murein DD-endopeptidase MepM/ murein hydrolase activator NlpD